mgnify:CR=1 FL=1
MEILESLAKIEKSLRIADHMVYITYPLIKDPHLLRNILEQLYSIADEFMRTVLEHEMKYKRINLKNLEELSPLEISSLFLKSISRFKIDEERAKKLKELLELWIKHKKSSVEFTRRERLFFMLNSRTCLLYTSPSPRD